MRSVLAIVIMSLLACEVPAELRFQSAVDGGAGSANARTVLVDTFASALDPAKWATSVTAGASVSVDAAHGYLALSTVPDTECGTARAFGLANAAVTSVVSLRFETALAAFHDDALYGDHQPRGLRSALDPNNVLEFISEYPLPSHVTCRSVESGKATETTVDIGADLGTMNTYRIEATTAAAQFFVNDNLVCVHTTNIPAGISLNPYFSTSDGCAGDIPLVIDRAELDIY